MKAPAGYTEVVEHRVLLPGEQWVADRTCNLTCESLGLVNTPVLMGQLMVARSDTPFLHFTTSYFVKESPKRWLTGLVPPTTTMPNSPVPVGLDWLSGISRDTLEAFAREVIETLATEDWDDKRRLEAVEALAMNLEVPF